MSADDSSAGACGDPAAAGRLGSRRGQLVLVAAGVIAMGLLPVVIAYMQLGYAGMAASTPSATTPTDDARWAVERAAFSASTDLQGSRPWSARAAVASDAAARFDARVASIETGSVERGTVHEIERNGSAAAAWASASCPDGPGREFGPCEAIDGVVVQERGGDTHVVAIAVDLRTVVEGATYDGTYVVNAGVGGRLSD
ncbi:DUF7261 family protein [Salinarchaeum laminariae]|uniref:DUF7261 family protein n=1 Tax=Salinarchaeum laminariae TaxID=869888 RepID=UPI0020BF2DEF|nr:hypothetical protein [Salinarchaeum laminariae]